MVVSLRELCIRGLVKGRVYQATSSLGEIASGGGRPIYGECVECEPETGVWGKSSSKIQGRAPWSGDKAERFLFSDVQGAK